MRPQQSYNGPALFSYGFRPLFLGAGAFGLGPVAVMFADCAFMLAIGAMVTTQIVAGRNWSNLKVVVPVLLYLAANITFHLEAILAGTADYGRRLGFAMVVMLILLIGGRIIPSFTRNWLVKQSPKPGALPVPSTQTSKPCSPPTAAHPATSWAT